MLLEKVVIGHSMESALFAYINGYYHVQSSNFYPLFFEESEGFSLFGTSSKKEIWTRLKVMLGFLSLNIDYPVVKNIRVQHDNIKVFEDNLLIDFEYEKCYIFDTLNVSHPNKIVRASEEEYQVIDDFKISRMGHSGDLSPVYLQQRFLSQIHFYNSNRVDGSRYITDIATVSTLDRNQIHDVDYSDTMMMFALRKHLNDMGIKGIEKRHLMNKDGTHPVDKFRLDHVQRFVTPIDRNTYQDTEKIKFVSPSAKEILNAAPH